MAQTPNERTPVLTVLRVAAFHDEALATRTDPEHARLRERNKIASDQLQALFDEYTSSVIALARPRARLVLVDRAADREIDLFDLAVRNADGGKPGALYGVLLPDGKTPIVQPVGPTEVKELRDLETRLSASGGALKAEWLPRITSLRERYETTLQDRAIARDLCASKRAGLADARRVWVTSYIRNQGALRELHANDTRTFESFFDSFRGKDSGGEEPEGGDTPVVA